MHTLDSNLVSHVLQIIKMAREQKTLFENCEQNSIDKKIVIENIEDIHCKLCRFLSSMISSPITGRIFLSTPQQFLNGCEIRNNAVRHLQM